MFCGITQGMRRWPTWMERDDREYFSKNNMNQSGRRQIFYRRPEKEANYCFAFSLSIWGLPFGIISMAPFIMPMPAFIMLIPF